mgnify:CR=1 FL=1
MATKKPIKKTRRRIRVPKGQFIQSFDSEAFETIYTSWLEELGRYSMDDIGMKGSHKKPEHQLNNLLDVVWNHGKIGRTSSASGPVSPPGGGKLKDVLDNFIKGNKGIEEDDEQFINKQFEYVKGLLTTKDKNPAYIMFSIPDYSTVNRKTLAHETTTVYGHYRTKDYIKFRNLKAKVLDNDKYREDLPEVPKNWISDSPGTAKPPMWQALFGNGNDDVVKDGEGLLHILRRAAKLIKETVIDFLQVIVEDQGTADEIWAIPHLRKEIMDMVWLQPNYHTPKNSKKPNPEGISAKTGNFRDDKIWRWFNAQIWEPLNIQESKNIKEVIDADKYKGRVKQYKLKVSRRQIRHIGILCGLEWKVRGRTVWQPQKEEKGEEKEAMDFSKSWEEVLAW